MSDWDTFKTPSIWKVPPAKSARQAGVEASVREQNALVTRRHHLHKMGNFIIK